MLFPVFSLLSQIFPPLYFLKMGAKSTTITGLSGTGDIMLTCFVNLSRNRTVGVRLGSGEKLDVILSSMNQVLENPSVQPLLGKFVATWFVHTMAVCCR